MRPDYDIIIVGAGLIGSALALSLHRETQLRIAVIERSAPLVKSKSANQRVVALGQAASHLLSQVGVLAELGEQHCYAYDSMVVWDEHSNGELSFSAAEQQQERLGFMVDSVRCTWLLQQAIQNQATLNQTRAKQTTIDVYYNVALKSLTSTDNLATLNLAGKSLSAPLVIGADGVNSWLRQQAKIFANHKSYNQRGIVACIKTSKSHQNTAWQRFLTTGPLAVLPLAENKSSIVWSADNERAEQIMALSDADFEIALTESLQNRLGEVSLCSKRQAFPLQSLQADHYFKRHVALVGDAAHSIHPLAGQGANLGFKDVQSLVTILVNQLAAGLNKSELGNLDVLQQYQRARKADNQHTDWLMTTLHMTYQSSAPWWSMARGVGMNWLSANSTIKQALARQAMGL